MTIKCPQCHADNPDTKQFCGDCGTKLKPSEEFSPSVTKTLETPITRLAIGSVLPKDTKSWKSWAQAEWEKSIG